MSTKKSKKARAKPTPRVGPLMSSDERRVKALSIAVPMARKTGAGGVSIKSVAEKMKVSAPLLFHIFGTSADFAKAIAKQAKKEGVTLPTTTVTVRMQAAIKSRAAAKKAAPPRKRSITDVKAIKNKLAAVKLPALLKPPIKPAASIARGLEKAGVISKVRKPLTAAQKSSKAAADRARRVVPGVGMQVDPKSALGKFAALPTPMQASIDSVS